MATTGCFQIDAFTDRPFSGNPAAVCLLDRPRDARWMQAFATEMNQSETAFVRPLTTDGRPSGFELRWFTPAIEVDLCGHATLAAAHAIWSEGTVPRDKPVCFYTKSGLLKCRQRADFIELDFPNLPVCVAEPPRGLIDALSIRPSYIGKSTFDKFLVVESEDVVRSLRPNFPALRRIDGMRGVIVTSRSADPRFDFVSRFFAPGAGIDEDPVTGSAHCCLGPFWGDRLGKKELTGYQASPRGGVVRVRVNGNRVVLGGKAVTVWRTDDLPKRRPAHKAGFFAV
jgi:predicted PhzF superfamily epimerase YddE/YHI9